MEVREGDGGASGLWEEISRKGKQKTLSIVAFGVQHVYTMIESHRLE